jgi:protein TonB
MPAPRQMDGRWWEGTSVSFGVHAVLLAVLFYAAAHVPAVVKTAVDASGPLEYFSARSGPARGGGGGGDELPAPAQQARIPLSKPSTLAAANNPADTPPVPNVPVVTAQAVEAIPGALIGIDTGAPGRGTGPGGGAGRGAGDGDGDGPGAGAGSLGGYGGDTYVPGGDVTSPQLVNEVRPNYTADAMKAKVQGVVEMQALVLADGSVDPTRIRVTRSLDARMGLDQQAIIAVRQWRFRPGRRNGQPVAVWVNVELTFTLR